MNTRHIHPPSPFTLAAGSGGDWLVIETDTFTEIHRFPDRRGAAGKCDSMIAFAEWVEARNGQTLLWLIFLAFAMQIAVVALCFLL